MKLPLKDRILMTLWLHDEMAGRDLYRAIGVPTLGEMYEVLMALVETGDVLVRQVPAPERPGGTRPLYRCAAAPALEVHV